MKKNSSDGDLFFREATVNEIELYEQCSPVGIRSSIARLGFFLSFFGTSAVSFYFMRHIGRTPRISYVISCVAYV